MPRDAFGRDQQEDPLAEMGWTRPAPAAAAEPPTFERADRSPAPPASPTPAALVPLLTQLRDGAAARPAPGRRARGRGRGRGLVTLVLLLFGAGVAVTALGLVSTVDESITRAIDSLPKIEHAAPGTAPAPGTGAGRQPGGSLLRPAGVRSAIARARREGRLESLRVAPDRIDADLVGSRRQRVILLVYATGKVNRVQTSKVPRSAIDPIAWSAVDAAAPMRIARAAARDAGRPVSRVSYLVLLKVSETPQWELFFLDGLHYTANAQGRAVRRVG